VRFAIRVDPWWLPLLALFGALPRWSYVALEDDRVRLRFGLFTCRFPRSSIVDARRVGGARAWGAGIGWHANFINGLAINGSLTGLVALRLSPAQLFWLGFLPARCSLLLVSLEEPAAFLEALGVTPPSYKRRASGPAEEMFQRLQRPTAAVLGCAALLLWVAPLLLVAGTIPLLGAISQTVLLPGDQPVALEYGAYELGYRGYMMTCEERVPPAALPSDVTVTRLSDGATIALEPVADPTGFCDHGRWTGTVYRFAVSQPGIYRISGRLPADPANQRPSALPALVIVPAPFLSMIASMYKLLPFGLLSSLAILILCSLLGVGTWLKIRLQEHSKASATLSGPHH
jgi:hypothetical protein